MERFGRLFNQPIIPQSAKHPPRQPILFPSVMKEFKLSNFQIEKSANQPISQ
jgi:hypothetical protein